jgi:hypothetical protein
MYILNLGKKGLISLGMGGIWGFIFKLKFVTVFKVGSNECTRMIFEILESFCFAEQSKG